MFLSKYGVARHIYIPVIKRDVADYAVSGDWTPAAGDVKISKDGGAAANVTNLPSAITMGNTAMWDFSLTAAEMQAAQIVVMVADSATKVVEDQTFIIETYGNASAQHELDIDAAQVAANVTQFGGSNLTATGGRPEVNTTHAAGTAWASGAITAGVIATDAIGAAELAADAVTEIQSGLATSAGLAGLATAADLATVAGYLDTEIAAIKNKTDALPTDPADQSALEALINAISAPTANENADALLDRVDGVETGFTLRQVLRLVAAVLAGKASGMGTTTAIFRDLGDTKDRVTATVDPDGNRSAIARDVG